MKLENKNGDIYGKQPFNDVRKIDTLRNMFDGSIKMYAERTAFLQKYDTAEPYKEISYRQFGEDVYNFAEGLIKLGLKDKKTAIIGENRYEWAVSYMALTCGVGTAVPIDKELTENEIKKLLEFAECSAVIISSAILKKNPNLKDFDIEIICMDGDFSKITSIGKDEAEKGSMVFKNALVKPEDVNVILFTSGTSSAAKGVMLSHKNICSCIMNICSLFDIDVHDRLFSLLPLHHTYECTCGFLAEIYVGASIAYCQGLRYMLKNMKESKPTIFFCVPMVLESIYKVLNKTIDKTGQRRKIELGIKITKFLRKFGIDMRRKMFSEIIDRFGGKLKMILVGAAPVKPETMQFFEDIGIISFQGYGMTECAPMITQNRLSRRRNDSVGLPLPELQIKISNPDEKGIGEITVKGDNVMVGYYKNPEETAKVLKDGWLYTGDMGRFEDGFLYITGRKKNLIITSNGENVFPEEMENEICKSDYISECMVYEQNNAIYIQAYPDDAAFEGMDEAEIEKKVIYEVKKINAAMPPYKKFSKIIVRKTPFVKTTTQKIKRDANI